MSIEFAAGVIVRRTGRASLVTGLMWLASILLFMTAVYASEWMSSLRLLVRIPLAAVVGWIMAQLWLRVSGAISSFFIPLAVPKIGGLYAVAGSDGTYRIRKVLAVDGDVVSVRIYSNLFEECPSHLDPTALTLGGITLGQPNGSAPTSIGVGHMPLALFAFWMDSPVFIQTEAVADYELEWYRHWLNASESGVIEGGGSPPLDWSKRPDG